MSSSAPNSGLPSIPNAPPLPSFLRARDAANKLLFGYSTTSQVTRPKTYAEAVLAHSPRSRYVSLGTNDQTATHKTGLEIHTLAINEQGTHVLLGGKEIFKTVKVEDGICAEELNLRSAIRSNPRQASGKTRQIYSIDIADVAWAKGECSNLVAAATSSGKIILYDLGRAGVQAAQLHEHYRLVHRLTFNPLHGNLLLSGGQDGTVRLWDAKDVRQASTLQSKKKYSGLSDGVRDVKWSPTREFEFAFGTDSGWIQCWDTRNLKTAKVKIPAHSMSCNTIDWHPDGKHILSASSDKSVRVWDFSTVKRQRQSWEIKAPYPIFHARWRPSCESSLRSNRALQCTQIVTTYDRQHTAVHLWDIRRPYLPFREIVPHYYNTAPTDLLWHSQDLLWTVGREGVFLQSDIQHTRKVIDKRNLQSFALSCRGELSCFTQKRGAARDDRHASFSSLIAPGMTSDSDTFGRSWTDDSVDHSFLSASLPIENTLMNNKSRASSVTGSALTDPQALTLNLDDILFNRKSFRPHQEAVRGPLPLVIDHQLVRFYSERYHFDLNAVSEQGTPLARIDFALMQNALTAHAVRDYQLARTWEILRMVVLRHLNDRIEDKTTRAKQKRSESLPTKMVNAGDIARELLYGPGFGESNVSQPNRYITGSVKQTPASESLSNIPTPHAEPLEELNDNVTERMQLLDPDKDLLALPPLLESGEERMKRQLEQAKEVNRRLTTQNLDGFHTSQISTQLNDKSNMIRRWSIQPKEALNLDTLADNHGAGTFPRLEKQDSNESFNFLEPSSDSRTTSFPSSYGSVNSSKPLTMVSERPSRPTRVVTTHAMENVMSHDFASGANASPAVPIPGAKVISARGEKSSARGYSSDTEMSPPAGRKTRTEAAMQYADLGNAETNATVSLPQHAEAEHEQPHKTTKEEPAITRKRGAQVITQNPDDAPEYWPEDSDPDYEADKPFLLKGLMRELITFYAGIADLPTASSMITLLLKLLPRTQPLDAAEASATVASLVDTYNLTGLGAEDIINIFETEVDHVVKSGLQPLQLEQVLITFHETLLSFHMYNEAGILRNIVHPIFPGVWEDFAVGNAINLHCSTCAKPIQNPNARCMTCKQESYSCPFCWLKNSPYEVKGDGQTPGRHSTLYMACVDCGHGGHFACLWEWFVNTPGGGGQCLTENCLCDCTPGEWRDEKARHAAKRRTASLRTSESIRSDEFQAAESSAVEHTRAMLIGGTGRGGRGGRGGKALSG